MGQGRGRGQGPGWGQAGGTALVTAPRGSGPESPLLLHTGQFRTGASRGLYSLGLYLKPSVDRLRFASDNGDPEAPK